MFRGRRFETDRSRSRRVGIAEQVYYQDSSKKSDKSSRERHIKISGRWKISKTTIRDRLILPFQDFPLSRDLPPDYDRTSWNCTMSISEPGVTKSAHRGRMDYWYEVFPTVVVLSLGLSFETMTNGADSGTTNGIAEAYPGSATERDQNSSGVFSGYNYSLWRACRLIRLHLISCFEGSERDCLLHREQWEKVLKTRRQGVYLTQFRFWHPDCARQNPNQNQNTRWNGERRAGRATQHSRSTPSLAGKRSRLHLVWDRQIVRGGKIRRYTRHAHKSETCGTFQHLILML